jgi:chromate reductase
MEVLMQKRKIFTLIGGISSGSLNQKLFRAAQELIAKEYELTTFEIQKLPFFSQDIENNPIAIVTRYKDKIKEADAFLFITPEYNRSIPGVLKNAIDWGSRPYGQNLWKRKPAATMGASAGNIGTYGAQHHLQDVLAYLDVCPMAQPEFYLNGSKAFNENGKLIDNEVKKLITNFLTSFSQWIEFISPEDAKNPGQHKSQGLEDSPFTH